MTDSIDRNVDRRRLARRRHGHDRHPLRIFAGSANRALAEEMATHLGVSVGRSTTTHLPDSEVHVQIDELVRGQKYTIALRTRYCSLPRWTGCPRWKRLQN